MPRSSRVLQGKKLPVSWRLTNIDRGRFSFSMILIKYSAHALKARAYAVERTVLNQTSVPKPENRHRNAKYSTPWGLRGDTTRRHREVPMSYGGRMLQLSSGRQFYSFHSLAVLSECEYRKQTWLGLWPVLSDVFHTLLSWIQRTRNAASCLLFL